MKEKIIMQGSVSAVAADYQVVIGSGTYYAINDHTLMVIE